MINIDIDFTNASRTACWDGDLAFVEVLLAHGSIPNPKGHPPLHSIMYFK